VRVGENRLQTENTALYTRTHTHRMSPQSFFSMQRLSVR